MKDSIQAPLGEPMSSLSSLSKNDWQTKPLHHHKPTHTLVNWLPLISLCWRVSCEPPPHKRMLIGVVLWESLVCRHSSFVYKWRSSCPIQRKQLCYCAMPRHFCYVIGTFLVGLAVLSKQSVILTSILTDGFLPFCNFLEMASYSG